jgi:nucleotide-binding universal stress UspA family protein
MRRYLDAELYLDESHPPADKRRLEENVQQARERLEQTLTAAEQQHRARRPIFQRVLVAVDGSATAHAAIATGTELAAEVAATVALLHVVDTSGTIATRPLTAATAARDEMMRRGEILLQQLDAQVPPNVHHEVLLREGVAADEIVAAADAWQADLIVMGSRGLGRLGRFLLGSTTEAVIRGARQPVLVVTHDVPTTANAQLRGKDGLVILDEVALHDDGDELFA